MKKVIVYICTVILSVFVGCAGMFFLIKYIPTQKEESVTKKVITVETNGISEGVQNIYDAVVVVEVYSDGTLQSSGTGFIYKKENGKAYILTNHHVVGNKGEVKISLTSGDIVDGSIISSDEYADICVLTIDEKYAKVVASTGKSDDVKLGDTVFTIGAPMGKEYAGTVTRGILSGKDRMVEVSVGGYSSDWVMKVMQTDAAINPGNSGGPLCNVSGEVIGINTLKIAKNEVEGLGFSIPIEDALYYASILEKGEKIERPMVGIEMTGLNSSYQLLRSGIKLDSTITSGVVVTNVTYDSPAAKAGLEKGDIITFIEDYEIKNVATFRYYLFKYKPGEKISIKFLRNKETKTVSVTLGKSE